MLSPSEALAMASAIDTLQKKRTNAAHIERQMDDTGLSREAGGTRAAHVPGQSRTGAMSMLSRTWPERQSSRKKSRTSNREGRTSTP